MKSKILLLIIALTALSSCSTKGVFDYRKQQHLYDWPSISIKSMSISDTRIIVKGYCSCYNAQKIEYFFLCSTDGTNFSKAEKDSAYHNGSGEFTGTFKPSAEGTYYVKFCADNNGLSYIESEVKAVEYKGIVPPVVSEAVDLGLSVKWATCNVGASKPEDYGGYYQWAGTTDVTSTSINLDWDNCPYHTGTSSGSGWTKYSDDKKETLEPSDDVAHVKLGGNWRMPTDTEWKALIDNCTWTWTVQNKVHGYKVTSNIKGYTDKSIFLPACGYRSGTSIRYNDVTGDDESKIQGSYWSSTRSKVMYGKNMKFNSTSFGIDDKNRYLGYSIRPVSD